jgi:phage tail-like protein
MDGDRGESLLVQPDQWARCAHAGTALLPGGGVELTWADDEPAATWRTRGAPSPPAPSGCEVETAAGLAFDHSCSAYTSWPGYGAVRVTTLDARVSSCAQGLRRPLGIGIDRAQRLYVAESGAGLVHVADLITGRLIRKAPVRCGRPVDIAPHCDGVLVLVRHPDRLIRLAGRRGPRPGPRLHPPCWWPRLVPTRIAAGPVVLYRAPGAPDALVATPDGTIIAAVPGATDVTTAADGTLVIARGPGRSLRRFAQDAGVWVELEPLAAPGFDGGAVAAVPDGAIAFTAGATIGRAAGSAARHVRDGRVFTYRLDSGAYRTRWGRVFIDACLPRNTSLGLRFVTSDDADVPDPVASTPPDRGARDVPDPDATPPLVSQSALEAASGPTTVYHRPDGSEQPWAAQDQSYQTYEAPVAAHAGRFLWIEIALHGTERVTPRVRALRIERPGHLLLRALPKAWSRDDGEAEFLQRFLAPAEGMLHEFDLRAATRAVLVDPRVTPGEALPWLASFAGLVLDGRWPEQARRTLIAEVYQLFRRRGTRDAIARIVEIYLGYRPVIVEQWQLRGLGGTVLGLTPSGPAAPSVGGSARETGTLGRFMVGGQSMGQDSYTRTAHRFCVLVPGNLTHEQRDVIRGIVTNHRPAHTWCELVELGPGMRVGDRLRVSLTSFVGPGGVPEPAVVGRSVVGADGVVGRPALGTRLGRSTVGEVLVG